jgi:hypothetical protein
MVLTTTSGCPARCCRTATTTCGASTSGRGAGAAAAKRLALARWEAVGSSFTDKADGLLAMLACRQPGAAGPRGRVILGVRAGHSSRREITRPAQRARDGACADARVEKALVHGASLSMQLVRTHLTTRGGPGAGTGSSSQVPASEESYF